MESADCRVLEERIAALDRLVQESLACSSRAEDKAAAALEKRFDGVNEFRAVLSDQQTHLASKDAMEQFAQQSRTDRAALHAFYQELRVAQTQCVTKTEADAANKSLNDVVDVLQQQVNRVLITVLTSMVITMLTALLWELAHRE